MPWSRMHLLGYGPFLSKENDMAQGTDFDTWTASVARELTELGVDSLKAKHVLYENEAWFRAAFDGGRDAGAVAAEWFNYD